MVAASPAASRLAEISDGASRALIYPEQGFQLHGFATPVADRMGGAPVDVIFAPPGGREPADRRYGNPILFPAVGITHNLEEARWGWRSRQLPMQQHGWARDAYWHVEARDTQSITGLLVPSTGMKTSFPFSFELRVRYALEAGALVLSAELVNVGDETFPYALGFHPYLLAPIGSAPGRDKCRVRLPAGVRLAGPGSWTTVTRSASGSRIVSATDPELPGQSSWRIPARRRWRWRTRRRGLPARLRRGERNELPHLGGLDGRARCPLPLPRALDGCAQRPQPRGHPHAVAGCSPPLSHDDLRAPALMARFHYARAVAGEPGEPATTRPAQMTTSTGLPPSS